LNVILLNISHLQNLILLNISLQNVILMNFNCQFSFCWMSFCWMSFCWISVANCHFVECHSAEYYLADCHPSDWHFVDVILLNFKMHIKASCLHIVLSVVLKNYAKCHSEWKLTYSYSLVYFMSDYIIKITSNLTVNIKTFYEFPFLKEHFSAKIHSFINFFFGNYRNWKW